MDLPWFSLLSTHMPSKQGKKRLEWVHTYLHNNFDDVIWSDETNVQLETHRCHYYRKLGEKTRSKPRAKHPTKVHVWAGISRKGATEVCIFEGIMAAPLYCEILQQKVLPFIQEHFTPPPKPPTDSCKIMTQNIPPVSLNNSIWILTLIGGKLQLNLLI